jgi:hypothetical protein
MNDAEGAGLLRTCGNRLVAMEWILTRILSEIPQGATQEVVDHHLVQLRNARQALYHEAGTLDPTPDVPGV